MSWFNFESDVLIMINNPTQIYYQNKMQYDWISYTVEYRRVQISDPTITLLTVHVPGGGTRNNKFLNIYEIRDVIEIPNYDTTCCVRSILLCLVRNNLETFQSLFENQLT